MRSWVERGPSAAAPPPRTQGARRPPPATDAGPASHAAPAAEPHRRLWVQPAASYPPRGPPNARGEPPPEAQVEPKLEAVGSPRAFGAATPLAPSFALLPALSDSGRPGSPALAAAVRAESARTSTDSHADYAP